MTTGLPWPHFETTRMTSDVAFMQLVLVADAVSQTYLDNTTTSSKWWSVWVEASALPALLALPALSVKVNIWSMIVASAVYSCTTDVEGRRSVLFVDGHLRTTASGSWQRLFNCWRAVRPPLTRPLANRRNMCSR